MHEQLKNKDGFSKDSILGPPAWVTNKQTK